MSDITGAGQHPATQAGQLANTPLARSVEAAIIEELTKTYHRDDTPLPAVGPTPPVAQPGQPPMSQWATDVSGVLKAVAIASLPAGGGLWLAGQIDPLALGLICGSPVALTLAIGRLVSHVKNVVEAAPAEHHHHYAENATIDQRSITSTTRGVIANTRNQPLH